LPFVVICGFEPVASATGGRRQLLRVVQKVCWRHVEPACYPLDCGEPEIPLCVLHAADSRAIHAAGATERSHRQPLSLALAAHVQSKRLGQLYRRHLRLFAFRGRRPLAEVLGKIPVHHRSVEMDLDVLVDHPVGGCFVVRLSLGRNVVDGLVEQEPLGFATRALRQDDQAAVKASLTTQRPEVGLVVGDEDGLLVKDDRIEPLIKLSEQISIAVACRPKATLIGSVDERWREALVDPELQATVAARRDGLVRLFGSELFGRPRRGLPRAQITATS